MRAPLLSFLLLPVLASGVLGDDPPREFDLHSAYLPTPVAGGNLISIKGSIVGDEGKAVLVVDPNSCSLDEFGDRTICTRIAPIPQNVSLSRLRTKDPTGKGRMLFALNGQEFAGKFVLVVPRRANDTYRLVHEVENKRFVVAFEQPERRRGRRNRNGGANQPALKDPVRETCSELPLTVDGTTATAKVFVKDKTVHLTLFGKTPHSNTEVRLAPVTYVKPPEFWQINVVECSEGPIRLPAIGKFSVTKDVTGLIGEKGIVLTFADGKSIKMDVKRP